MWIDFDNGGLLDAAMALPHEWATPDVVVEQELEELGATLRARGITVLVADEYLQQQWERVRTAYRLPSDADLYGLVHARYLSARLVTGDRDLRKAAEAEGVEVSGVLWVLDQVVEIALVSGADAARALRRMLELGARLPSEECETRLRRWIRMK